jgi:hypothetical protein
VALYFKFVEKQTIGRVFKVYRDVKQGNPSMGETAILKKTVEICLFNIKAKRPAMLLEMWFSTKTMMGHEGGSAAIQNVKDAAVFILQEALPLPPGSSRDYRFDIVDELFQKEFS